MKKLAMMLVLCLCVAGMAVAEDASVQTIAFGSTPTTGYEWSFELDGSAVTVTDAGFAMAEENADLPGAGGEQSFEIKGVAKGEANITFTYGQSWEPHPDDPQVVVHALVGEDHTLTLNTLTDTRVMALDGMETPTLTVALEGNMTTGYTWLAEANGDAIKVTDEGYVADESGEAVGVGGVHTFVIEGTGEGVATVVFTYAREWEETEPAANTITLSLTVAADGNIVVE